MMSVSEEYNYSNYKFIHFIVAVGKDRMIE